MANKYMQPTSMMQASAEALERLMEEDDRIVVMTADLVGSCKLSAIEKRFSDRFINVGIAEQNMITIAAGLAHEGMRPFVHTFSVFASLRACEQIRTDVFYNKANVKIIGTHCGFSSAIAGPTHFSLEDVGVISSMPGSRIFTPADAVSAAALIEKLYQDDKPAYIRLDRNPIPVIYPESYEIQIGKGHILKKGTKIALVACGASVWEALQAAQQLETEGIHVTVVDMCSIKPIDEHLLESLAMQHHTIITIEEQNIYGGLGMNISRIISQFGYPVKIQYLGIPDCYPKGNLVPRNRELYALDSRGIVEAVRKTVKV